MAVKLTSLQQLEQLRIGNILKKLPIGAKPDRKFNWYDRNEIDTYEVKGFNLKENILKLTQIEEPLELFEWPNDVRYTNISSFKIISEKVWWIMEPNNLH